jgi:hypothetical protein
MRRIVIGLVLTACVDPSVHIDGRYDVGSSGVDAGASVHDAAFSGDAGANDAYISMSDGGCTRATPPSPAGWTVPNTGGPAGETVTQCLARGPTPNVDSRVPADQRYDVTTFGGGTDTQATSCGMTADATWFYAAGAQRFPCGQHIRLVDPARAHCAIVQVSDTGPNVCVEVGAGAPIWDLSPLATQHLFGGSSYGWSDRVGVIGAPVGSANALGDCDATITDPSTYLAHFVGGPCTSDADCTFTGGVCRTAAQGFPGGHCTVPCGTGGCPDQAGANAFTGCADLTGSGDVACAARCDYTLFPTTGCRDGYGCYDRANPTNPTGAHRNVCLPLPCM